MDKLYLVDTNVLLDKPEIILDYKVVILGHVVRELEKHKLSKYPELAYNARKATRYISDNLDSIVFDTKDYIVKFDPSADSNYVDNKIIQACIDNNYGLISNDLLLKIKAQAYDIELKEMETDNSDDYKGYREMFVSEKELNYIIDELDKTNPYELHINEYLIIKDITTKHLPFEEHIVLDVFKYDGNFYNRVPNKGFNTNLLGKFKPYDVYQQCVLDSLQENKMTMIKGKAGSGKSLLAFAYSMKQIEKGKKDKLICFVNPVASKNSAKLGYYPGTKDEKLMDSSIGSMLSSKFGDKLEVEKMIAKEELVLLPFADIRGFDTTGMNAIVWILESQNLDIELMKLAIQRVGNDSELIIDGDYNAQVDSSQYEGSNNGMRRVSEIFRGQKYYGEIELPIIYRSEMAKQADLM